MRGTNYECQHNSHSARCFQSKKRLYHFLQAWHTLRSIFQPVQSNIRSNSFWPGQALNSSNTKVERHKNNHLCEIHKEIIKLHTPSKITCRWALKNVGTSCWLLLIAKCQLYEVTDLSHRNMTMALRASHHFLLPKLNCSLKINERIKKPQRNLTEKTGYL